MARNTHDEQSIRRVPRGRRLPMMPPPLTVLICDECGHFGWSVEPGARAAWTVCPKCFPVH